MPRMPKHNMFFRHVTHKSIEFGGNNRAVTLLFPWGFIKVNDLLLPPITLRKFFVRFSFSPFCVKTTIPLLSFISLWFVSFFFEACFSLCKNTTKLCSLVRRPHSFGLYSHSRIKYFNSLITNVFIKLL